MSLAQGNDRDIETALVPTEPKASHEIQVAHSAAHAQYEIQGQITVAKKFPRNEDAIYGKLVKSANRPTFAGLTTYSYPRGGSTIEGPSVYLAREIARCWGNIQYGSRIIHDDDESRTVRGWAWDVETNARKEQESTFKKLVQRKDKKGGQTRWVQPDERDLRELTNKHASICERNCLLHLLPPDLAEEIIQQAKKTLRDAGAKDPDATRKAMVRAFAGLGVTVEQLEVYLAHPINLATPDELADLRGIFQSIRDGHSSWLDYVRDKLEPEKGPVSIDSILNPSDPPTDTNGGKATDGRTTNTPAVERFEIDERIGHYKESLSQARMAADLDPLRSMLAADDVLDAKAKTTVGKLIDATAKKLQAATV